VDRRRQTAQLEVSELLTVPFDPNLVEAKLALRRIGPDEMPNLACDALEAGLEGPTIRRLAGLINPSGWETDQILPRFMEEAGLACITPEIASVRLARELARRLLAEGLDPLRFTGHFEGLWRDGGYPQILQDAGSLDDQMAITDQTGQSESELREYAHGILSALASEQREE
jgi:hypothetical protein